MKKISLIIAFVGIVSTAMFANTSYSIMRHDGKPSKMENLKKKKPVKKVISMNPEVQKELQNKKK